MYRFKSLLLLALLLLGTACYNFKKGIKVKIYNYSSTEIIDITVYTTDPNTTELFIKKLSSGDTWRGFLDMTNNTVDGGYIIKYITSDSISTSKGAGYFTNGAPLDRKVSFFIEEDTVYTELKPSWF